MNAPAGSDLLLEHLKSDPLMLLMAVASIFIVALSLERLFALFRVRLAMRGAERVVQQARKGTLADARKACDGLGQPVRQVFVSGLDRAVGTVRGDAAMAMSREQKRVVGVMKAWVWMLGTAGALMPFVGLLGTVLGVMSSFRAIGDSGQGGFAVVSAGISQALIATAVGLFVALEAVILYNLLQNIILKLSRDLGLLVDEMIELIHASRADHAGSAAK
jgi:biopolymer transport protein ExbB